MNVQVYFSIREPGEFCLELFDLRPFFADHDAGPGRVDVDLGLVGRTFDLDLGDPGVVQPLLDETADADVIMQEHGIVFLREPARFPPFDDPETKPLRVYFLPHATLPYYCFSHPPPR